MAATLFVRINSDLDADELDRRLLERRPRFQEVPGLVQKLYGRDDVTGDVCGIYFFDSAEALAAFRETELARTIPEAYEAVEVRREETASVCRFAANRASVGTVAEGLAGTGTRRSLAVARGLNPARTVTPLDLASP